MQYRQDDIKTHAQKLYQWLIQPIENDLKQAHIQTIIYAPDGQLRYIPLAALFDGNQWLVQRFQINNITATSLTNLDHQPPQTMNILAGAFGRKDTTVKLGDQEFHFAGLPAAITEVENLGAIVPSTRTFVDTAFGLKAIKPFLNDYKIIHFATHAAFLPGQPENSFIVFGDGSNATLSDIGNWTLTNVDLVVLSACETGVAIDTGGKLALKDGREVLGLGYQFQQAGAKATIASLWEVDDGGTQALMDAFYAALKTGKMTKAEALQQAQIALIHSKVGQESSGDRADVIISATVREKLSKQVSDNLSHPYYWAPFILIGNGL